MSARAPGIRRIAEADPARLAIVCDDRRVTYGELESSISRAARKLQAAGIAAGDAVAVMMHNGVEIFAVWNAVARLGGVVVPVSHRLTPGEVAYMIDDAEARAFVYDDPSVEPILPSLSHLAGAWDAGEPELWSGPERPWLDTAYVESTVATMPYTSGTTGRPKGVRKSSTSAGSLYNSETFLHYWDFRPTDTHLLTGPAYHGGPGSYAQLHLMVGSTLVVMARFDGLRCLELIENERVTTGFMVPANFIRILEQDWRRFDLSSIRLIIHAAAVCPEGLKRKMMAALPPGTLWEYYGSIEGSFSIISPGEWTLRPGSVGRPMPGVRIVVLDDDGQALPPGEVGTIYSSGLPGWTFEYFKDPEKTAGAWRGDLFTAGDMGSLDEDGYLYIADRRTDLIISGGVNIYAAEVEGALMDVPGVVDAAVFGVPDDAMGQIVHAVVEVHEPGWLDGEAVLGRLDGVLAKYKWPRSFEFVDELPREPSGKVKKYEMREKWMRDGGA